MKPRKSKVVVSGAWVRRYENWHCPRYEDCLDDAAKRDLACVPCKDCKDNPKKINGG